MKKIIHLNMLTAISILALSAQASELDYGKTSTLDDLIVPSESQTVLTEEVRLELNRVAIVLSPVQSRRAYARLSNRFLDEKVLSPNIQYELVDQLPSLEKCNERLRYEGLPKSTQVEQVACTIDHQTWIRKELYSKMNLRNRALLLVHEGLRRLPADLVDSQMLAKITSGLFISLDHLQRQFMGRRDALSEHEMVRVKEMYRSAMISGLDGNDPLRVTPDVMSEFEEKYEVLAAGGGLISDDLDGARNSYVGIGVTISGRELAAKRVELVVTNACNLGGCRLSDGAHISNTWVSGNFGPQTRFILGESAKIQDTALATSSHPPTFSIEVLLGRRAQIVRSRFPEGVHLKLDDDAKIDRSTLFSGRHWIEEGASIENSEIRTSEMVVRPNSHLLNWKATHLEIGRNYQDIPRRVIQALPQMVLMFVYGLTMGEQRYAEFLVPARTTIDLQGEFLCGGEQNHIRFFFDGMYTLDSKRALQSACVNDAEAK